jgi:abequosyltransferase
MKSSTVTASPLLSICIPTYNRAYYLRDCLLSVIAAAKGYEHEVNIIVSDNASEDDTPIVVESIRSLYSNFHYVRRTTNIGAGRNFRYVASLAKTPYVWVFGDDDMMSESAIRKVLARLTAGFNLVVCNFSVWTKDFSSNIKRAALPGSEDKIFNSPDALMQEFGPVLGYISSVVIRKTSILELPSEKYEAFVEYGFSFMFAVYKGACISCKAAYVAEPVVLNRSGNSGDYDWYKYFVTGLSVIFDELKTDGYSSAAIKSAKQMVISRYVLMNLLVRKRDQKSMNGLFSLMYKNYKSYWLFWFGIFPIFLIPSKLVWIAWLLRKRVKETLIKS